MPSNKEGKMPDLGEAVKRTNPALDHALERYRERRREYEHLVSGKKRSTSYRSQRGVRRDYRV